MSYVEEFCEDIAIINHGNIVLSGDLDEIKLKYGENQLVISSTKISKEQLESILRDKFSDIVDVTGQSKEDLIVKLKENVTRSTLLSEILKNEIELESFETYTPSLNDIFIAKVGDD